eukprot:jgi/Ulvmu1/375/UM001_0382.1
MRVASQRNTCSNGTRGVVERRLRCGLPAQADMLTAALVTLVKPPAAPCARGAALACRAESINGSNGSSTGIQNVVVIGSGPAGYTAAIYAARANLKPVVFEGVSAGGVRGGQLMTTNEVENFPGFPEGITGPDLMDRMRAQAQRWGAELVTDDVLRVDTSVRPFIVETEEVTVRTHTIILATGATARRLGIPSEKEFWGRGISACAICDGASPIFKGQEVAVVGGGDSATEEAHYITKYARHVHLLVRGPEMRASKTMRDRVLQHSGITVHYNSAVADAYGDGEGLQGLRLVDTVDGSKRDLPLRGLFYGIGHNPNSGLVKGQVELDKKGYVVVRNQCETSLEGVFAAGDLHDTEWRQAITAAGSGCAAAIAAERYLAAADLLVDWGPAATSAAAAPPAEAEAEQEPAPTVEAPFDVAETRHKGQFALRKLYHETEQLIAVLYTSPTCGPCRTLKPMVSTVVDEFDGQMKYVEIDIEQDPEIAEAAGVAGTPTLQCFKQKERVESISGVRMKSEWRRVFGKYIDGEGDDDGGSDAAAPAAADAQQKVAA